jgi:surface protein
MAAMFKGAKSLNQPIGNWNVQNVSTMEKMFYHATSFNQPVGNWDVQNVSTMQRMFKEARSFKQTLPDEWAKKAEYKKSVLNDEFLQEAIREHAVFLGMDPNVDQDYMWIAEEALKAPLPEGWQQGQAEDGTPYHFNPDTKESLWEHPLDEKYREKFRNAKATCIAAAASTTNTTTNNTTNNTNKK